MEYNTGVSGRLRVMPIVAVQRKITMPAGQPVVTLHKEKCDFVYVHILV